MLCLKTGSYNIAINDDPIYTEGSVDNTRTYSYHYWLGEQKYQPSAKHGLRVTKHGAEIASCIVLGAGGATGVHEHSALLHDQSCIVAVSAFICALAVPALQLQWQVQVDWATCFGVYHAVKHDCYISHGECEIACVSYAGELVWSVSGKDIFTNGFHLYDDYIDVLDWNHEMYRIKIPSGESYLIAN
jgi:hypothetical protein